ncbi:DUF262 domain-containing protein [Pseudomonas qingdaonensis]|nr:DUF262 domain-containing protein [Pseudomonas qingdaonensis]
MNARGMPLTAFETFKARYERHLHTQFDGHPGRCTASRSAPRPSSPGAWTRAGRIFLELQQRPQ